MRLVRMKLRDWRGIGEREIAFDEGVTILEGPNEIGKSSIVEALFMLINDFASSSKQAIKGVQPVGRDVGSMVEAEIASGEYHFTYRKTFNKGTQTELSIAAPGNSQVSGRDAHDRVLKMLGDTVDLDLWKALLVDQGGQIRPADLKDSAGLSKALDAAATGPAAAGEDVALLDAARAEYETYFTLKSGKDRLSDLEKSLADTEAELADASAALREVEDDAARLQSLDNDIRRREAELPTLKQNLEKHQQSKQAADALRSALQVAQSKLTNAEERQRAAASASAERRKLAEEINAGEQSLAAEREKLAPLQERVDALKADVDTARQAVEAQSASTRDNKRALDVAQADAAHLDNVAALAQHERLAGNIKETEAKLQQALDELASIHIDAKGFDALRDAESAQRVIAGQRDHAATRVTITAEQDLGVVIDGESSDIATGETHERNVATKLTLKLPGIAEIHVSPPQSAADLDERLRESQRQLDQLMAKYKVDSLEAARTALAKRQGAEQAAQQHKTRLADLIGDRTVQEVQQHTATLKRACDDYVANRDADKPIPEDANAARVALDAARQAIDELERAHQASQQRERGLRDAYDKADKQLRDAQHQSASLEATLKERQRRLDSARGETSDEALKDALEKATASETALKAEVERLTGELDQLSPDAIEGLFENAASAIQRANTELAAARQQRAVYEDRLARAKADGRFEVREAAERQRDALKAELDNKRRRANAAKRLWETLNKHRDDARQAYVRPLRDAIERLGRIVFGNDFQVAVDDDWTLSTRTLNGITLPYDSLSVGTKEQLGILTRLAAAQIVSEHGGVPLIIDDALGFSDPDRLETMGAAIAAAGKSCQVIILTCAPGRFTHVGSAAVVRF